MNTKSDCIFCKIVNGEIPSERVVENDTCIAIRDVNPQAPVHILVMPKEHVENVVEAADHPELTAALFRTVAEVAEKLDLKKDGFRIISNVGTFGCQSVKHLHIHVLGGKQLSEKMD